jgi:hypothetical protein
MRDISRRKLVFGALGATAALGGCAVGRDEVKLPGPSVVLAKGTKNLPSNGRSVIVRTATDDRVFANESNDVRVPTLDPNGTKQPDVKGRAFARKRNGYGMALGDVLMEPGQSVAGQVKITLEAALRQAGYTVVPDGAPPAALGAKAPSQPLVVTASVKTFWAWAEVSFTSIAVKSRIETQLTVTGAKTQPGPIVAEAQEAHMAVGNEVWGSVVQKALDSYRAQATAKFAAMA